MFSSIETISARAAYRAADIIDLAIEFVTLGEYGLEYPEPDRRPTGSGRPRASRSGYKRPVHPRPACQPGRIRSIPPRAATPSLRRERNHPSAALLSVLRPPRIDLEELNG